MNQRTQTRVICELGQHLADALARQSRSVIVGASSPAEIGAAAGNLFLSEIKGAIVRIHETLAAQVVTAASRIVIA